MRFLHIHDCDYLEDQHTLPFLGQFDWEAIMRSLKSINYQGDLTFEIIGFLNAFPAKLLPAALKLAETIGRYLISLFEKA